MVAHSGPKVTRSTMGAMELPCRDVVAFIQQPTGPDGYNTWIITGASGSSFWGVASEQGPDTAISSVRLWHGPFNTIGEALLNLQAARSRSSGAWPSLYIEKH